MHVSYYEADAFARWAGKDLPTEAEWEVAARDGPDRRRLRHRLAMDAQRLCCPIRAIAPPAGALGEYNGKFMINQMVLRGCSLATPEGHARASYRNFFYPPARWQFTGLRLADYVCMSRARRASQESSMNVQARIAAARPSLANRNSRATCSPA